MGRSRNIKPGFFQNPELSELEFSDMLLFIGLWTESDREGRLEDRPAKLLMKLPIFAAKGLSAKNIDESLSRLQGGGFIYRYPFPEPEPDSKDQQPEKYDYIQILKFLQHQHPHHQEKQSIIPPPKFAPRSEEVRTKARCNPSDSLNPHTDSLNPQTENRSFERGNNFSSKSKKPDVMERLQDKSWAGDLVTDKEGNYYVRK